MKFSNWLNLVALIIAIVIVWSLKEIVILIFAGVIISMALCTLTDKINKILPIPRQLFLLLTLLILCLMLTISLLTIIPQFSQEFEQLITQLPFAAKELWQILTVAIEKIYKLKVRFMKKKKQ